MVEPRLAAGYQLITRIRSSNQDVASPFHRVISPCEIQPRTNTLRNLDDQIIAVVEYISPSTVMATAPSASEAPPSTTAVKTPIWDRGTYAAMNLVRPGLFLGSFAARRDEAALHAAGVTHVLCLLSVAPHELPPGKFSQAPFLFPGLVCLFSVCGSDDFVFYATGVVSCLPRCCFACHRLVCPELVPHPPRHNPLITRM